MTPTKQPEWKCVLNLGDVDPIEHGGYFIFVDQTGVHAPKALKLFRLDDQKSEWTVYRFVIEPCTLQNGVLSDNPFHPECAAWFAGTEEERKERPQDTTYLKNISDFAGIESNQLAEMFCSEKLYDRARAWEMVGDYHGFEEIDDDSIGTYTYHKHGGMLQLASKVRKWLREIKESDVS